MAEVDLERLVLPALFALLVLGALMIVVTSGGAGQSLAPLPVEPVRSTPAKAPATAPAKSAASAATAPSGRFAKVKEGDTAASIAAAAAISVDGLRDLNPSIDPDSLQVGQTLKLAR